MASVEDGTSSTSSAQAGPEESEARGTATVADDAQIDSSDEYDPAQDISLPGSSHSHSAARPPSTHVDEPSVQALASATPTESVMQHVPVKDSFKDPNDAEKSSQAESPAQLSQSPSARSRLPHDIMGILEDQVADDPKGDMKAWLSLLNEYKKRGKIEAMDSIRAY